MLPETAQTKLNIGEVVAHGEGYVDEVSIVLSCPCMRGLILNVTVNSNPINVTVTNTASNPG